MCAWYPTSPAILLAAVLTACSAVSAGQFASVDDAVVRARDTLAREEYAGKGAVILVPAVPGDSPVYIRLEIQVYAGYRCYRFRSDYVLLEFLAAGAPLSILARASGCHQVRRDFLLEPGEIRVLDDLYLEPVGPGSSAEIIGLVQLEDRARADGIVVRVDDPGRCITDDYGRFHFAGLGAGKVCVSAFASGYTGLCESVELHRGEKKVVRLEGFRRRAALVRWAYQPDGSRDLRRGLESGVALLRTGDRDRVSFSQGFEQTDRGSDLLITQQADQLIARIFDVGANRNGFIEIRETPFEDVLQAPDAEYAHEPRRLAPGAVFIVKCYDGGHYGKLEVLEILDGEYEYESALGRLASQPLQPP